MGDKSEINGLSVPKTNQEEKLASTVDLYIGIFFDGTNNNKYQVMLGKLFRWKEIYDKHCTNNKVKECFKDNEEPNVFSILKRPRSYWEEGEGRGVFSRSEIEYLYYGYGDWSNADSTFIEEKSIKTLSNEDIHQLSAKPDNINELNKLREVADQIVNKNENGNLKSKIRDKKVKGAPAQNSTYTNVAILESLYKCGSNVNNQDEITERHISIYIEGSGTDMQISAIGCPHTVGYILMGLGKGTGPTGVESKTKKSVQIINKILKETNHSSGIQRVNLHFDICGFSRGSTSARHLCYIINADPDNPSKSFDGSKSIIKRKDYKKYFKRFTGSKKEFLPIGTLIAQKEIRNLIIADTVASVGVKAYGFWSQFKSNILRLAFNTVSFGANIFEHILPGMDENGHIRFFVNNVDQGTQDVSSFGVSTFHHKNVDDYGLWASELAQSTIHICALDELRENFALVDVESSILNNKGTEIFLPGCHTDIGGGTSLGQEEAYVITKHRKRRLFSFLCNSEEDINSNNLLPIDVESLKQLGWIPSDCAAVSEDNKTASGRVREYYIEKHDETNFADNSFNLSFPNIVFQGRHDNIVLYRHVFPGYSNISLKIFHQKANEAPFKEIPSAFSVPNELRDFAERIINEVEKPGRFFFYPQNEKEYRDLRNKYLHLSFNEQFIRPSAPANNSLVNGPEFIRRKIQGNEEVYLASRIIYKGEYGFEYDEMLHMFDYDDAKSKTIKIPIHMEGNELSPMRLVSENGISMIKRMEGCRLVAYTDSVGVWTIGYGHTAGVYQGMEITQEEADEMLTNEVETYASEVVQMVNKPLNQNQIDSLTSFAYNVGTNALRNSTLLKCINDEKSTENIIREQFGRWIYAGSKVEKGLVDRRKDEADLFFQKPDNN